MTRVEVNDEIKAMARVLRLALQDLETAGTGLVLKDDWMCANGLLEVETKASVVKTRLETLRAKTAMNPMKGQMEGVEDDQDEHPGDSAGSNPT